MSTWRRVPLATKIYMVILVYLLLMLGGLAFLKRTTDVVDLESLQRWWRGEGAGQTPVAQLTAPTPAPTITIPPGAAWFQAAGNVPVFARPVAADGPVALLESGEVAIVVGASSDQQWWAIQMPYFQDGRAWVSASQVQVQNPGAAPLLEASGAGPAQATPDNKPRPSVKALTNVNVRSGPATRFLKIATLEAGQEAEVLGVSPDRFWWLVQPPGSDQQGWVARDYVVASNADDAPVVGMQGIGESTLAPGKPFLTALYPTVNVRAGPDLTFAIVGQLAQGQTAVVTGKTSDALWWQIEFPTSPDGVGWVAAAFVQAENVETVPALR